MLETSPLVIEWAERIQETLPQEHLEVNLSWVDEDQRDLVFIARGERYHKLLARLRKQVFGVA